MAGMFYSLKQAAEKLGKTEDDVRQLVKQGRLREFRDGPNLLFKTDEVESLLSDTAVSQAESEPEIPPEETGQDTAEQEISLAQQPDKTSDSTVGPTGDETVISEEKGINILGDSEYQLADDTVGKTKAASDEASLKDIEEDVSLDSFGSGSGLLDLSLQADDTSLGGVLDEIYAPEGEQAEGAEGTPGEVAADAEQMFSEQDIDAGLPAAGMAAASVYIEPEPDMTSNAFGIMMFLPLIALVYMAVIVVSATAGLNRLMPSILESTHNIIWYIMIGFAAAAGLIIAAAFVLGGKSAKPAVKKTAKKETQQPESD